MQTAATRARKAAKPQLSRTVKASIPVPLDLHIRWGACAAMAGKDRAAFAVEILEEATRWLVLSDRRKAAGQDTKLDRQGEASPVSVEGGI